MWSGWYAKTNEKEGLYDGLSLGSLLKGEGWQLGRWMQDSDLWMETNEAALGTATGFWWTSQNFVGLVVWSAFVGVEGMSILPT